MVAVAINCCDDKLLSAREGPSPGEIEYSLNRLSEDTPCHRPLTSDQLARSIYVGADARAAMLMSMQAVESLYRGQRTSRPREESTAVPLRLLQVR
jgi:hypothetical protein